MTPLPCPPAHWPAFSRRLDTLLALPVGARATALDDLPAAEAELRPWLAAVLADQDGALADGYLTGPRLGPAAAEAPAHQAGQRVGPWQLLRELGRGGMGVVWLAERADGAYTRQVALKLPHLHLLENLNAAGVRARFARERDILAGLSHPHIARFYDAGVSDGGQPWLALEAVDGLPITHWCQQRALPLDARLALFDQVADAVAHAHGRLVAHRDLKPANVLVTPDGQVKLLDFGIAKLLQAGATGDPAGASDSTVLTRAQGVLATPQYAAPEQLAGGPVSVATDVYALGLMLFELLTDQPAFSGRRRDAPPDDAPRPSRVAAGQPLRRALAGDLDAIVAHALQPVPEARYPSVAALADDLRRHRQHLPVQAHRLGTGQRLARFVRRHRLPVALGSALALALVVGVAGIVWQAQEARAQARRAESVKDFLLGIFSASDPRLAGNRPQGQTPARELLDRAVARIDERLADDPALRIELLHTAAGLYRELNEPATFQTVQQRLLALVAARHGPLHPLLLGAAVDAAEDSYRAGDLSACRARQAEADALLRQVRPEPPLLRAQWWINQSLCLRDQAQAGPQRIAALQQADTLYARHAPGQRGQVTALLELAGELTGQMQLAQAIPAHQRAMAMAERLPGRNEAELQTLSSNLGLAQLQAGDLPGAVQSLAQAVAIAGRTTGLDHPTAWLPRSVHARAVHMAGDREAAGRLFGPLLAALPDPAQGVPDSHRVREDIGERLAAEGQPDAALPLLRLAVDGHARQRQHDFAHRRALRHLGDALARAGRPDEARQVLAESLRLYETHDSPGSQASVAIRERWARLLLDAGELDAAQVQFRQAIAQAANPAWAHVALAQAGLARVALARGDAAQADRFSQAALATWQGLQGFRDVRMQAALWRVRAAVLDRLARPDEARALRDQALADARRTDAPGSPTLTRPDYLGL